MTGYDSVLHVIAPKISRLPIGYFPSRANGFGYKKRSRSTTKRAPLSLSKARIMYIMENSNIVWRRARWRKRDALRRRVDDHAVIGRLDAGGTALAKILVVDLMIHVRQDGPRRFHTGDPLQRLLDVRMRRMWCIA